jgi:hypothetical protein
MVCHECAQEAAGQCRSCRRAFCSGHGAELCRTCAVSVTTADNASRLVARRYLQCENARRMPTVFLDDPGPPACYFCEGLARQLCENCHNLYCPDHAGCPGWCAGCTHSARTGMRFAALVFLFLALILLLMWILNQSQN